jgi:hypothetical protein
VYSIPIKQNVITYCKELLKTNNFGLRGVADGNYLEQLRGIIGQSVILDLLDMPALEPTGFDGGIDIIHNGKSYDIKSMGRNSAPKSYFVNNLIGHQKDYIVDRYMFLSLNRNDLMLTICGWIDKKDFFDKANFYPEGTKRTRSDGTFFNTKADLYELENSKLNQINNLQELKNI